MIGRVMRECNNYFDGGNFKGDLRIEMVHCIHQKPFIMAGWLSAAAPVMMAFTGARMAC